MSLWSWYASNGYATASQITAAYNAITNKGAVSNFSYLVWNDLVNKVNETVESDGSSWNSRYTTYNGTLMNSSNKTLTAQMFNSLRYNIGLHVSTGISEVSRGDPVYGHYFITLTDCLNQWINTL